MLISNDKDKLIIALLITQLAGIFGALFTAPSISDWYKYLLKPEFTPPAWVFGPVWISLYFIIGFSAYLVWKEGLKYGKVKIALSIFGIQLFLNSIWTILFFGLKNPLFALIDAIILWILAISTAVIFSKISKLAGWLFLPYILWLSFALYLNYNILILNKLSF